MTFIPSVIGGTLFCDLWVFFDCFLTNVSIFNLVNIALDRYQAVCRPLSYSSSSFLSSPRAKCFLAWAASLLCSLPVLSARVDDRSCHLITSHVPWLVVYLPCICFLFPLTIITMVYTIILYTMLKKSKTKERSREVVLLAVNSKLSVMIAGLLSGPEDSDHPPGPHTCEGCEEAQQVL